MLPIHLRSGLLVAYLITETRWRPVSRHQRISLRATVVRARAYQRLLSSVQIVHALVCPSARHAALTIRPAADVESRNQNRAWRTFPSSGACVATRRSLDQASRKAMCFCPMQSIAMSTNCRPCVRAAQSPGPRISQHASGVIADRLRCRRRNGDLSVRVCLSPHHAHRRRT